MAFIFLKAGLTRELKMSLESYTGEPSKFPCPDQRWRVSLPPSLSQLKPAEKSLAPSVSAAACPPHLPLLDCKRLVAESLSTALVLRWCLSHLFLSRRKSSAQLLSMAEAPELLPQPLPPAGEPDRCHVGEGWKPSRQAAAAKARWKLLKQVYRQPQN